MTVNAICDIPVEVRRIDRKVAVVHSEHGPPTFRSPEHGEGRQGDMPLAARDVRARIHRSDSALHHRQQQRPFGIAGLQILLERIGDELILPAIE